MIVQNWSTWHAVVAYLQTQSAMVTVRVSKGRLPHPKTFGMSESVGLPKGQAADYRKVLARGAGFHVKDFGTHYEAHIDAVHPSVDLHEHLRLDAPRAYIAGGIALGAFIGNAVGKSKDSTLAGAAVGGLVAAFLTRLKSASSNHA